VNNNGIEKKNAYRRVVFLDEEDESNQKISMYQYQGDCGRRWGGYNDLR
jgi:hypothetical protein